MSEFNTDFLDNTAFYMSISHYNLMKMIIMLNNKQRLPEFDNKNHAKSGQSVKIKFSITVCVIF